MLERPPNQPAAKLGRQILGVEPDSGVRPGGTLGPQPVRRPFQSRFGLGQGGGASNQSGGIDPFRLAELPPKPDSVETFV